MRLDTVHAETAKSTTVADFERASLNRRRGATPPTNPNVPPAHRWNELIDIRQTPGDVVAFGVAGDRQGTGGAIVAAWPGSPRSSSTSRSC